MEFCARVQKKLTDEKGDDKGKAKKRRRRKLSLARSVNALIIISLTDEQGVLEHSKANHKR